MRFAGVSAQVLLLWIPLISQVEAVVNYADLSLNSELSVIRKLQMCFAL